MVWTNPRTWTAGPPPDVITAALLNEHLRDNLQFLYDTLFGGSQVLLINEDFAGGSISVIGTHGWSETGVGTISYKASEENHPGIVGIATGSTANTFMSLNLGIAAALHSLDEFDLTVLLRLGQTDANTLCRFGVVGTNVLAPLDGVYIEKLSTDTQWFGVNRVATVQTRTAALLTVTTGWTTLRVRRVDTSNMGFSVNGGTEILLSTNIPSIAGFVAIQIQNPSVSVNKFVDVDQALIKIFNLVR